MKYKIIKINDFKSRLRLLLSNYEFWGVTEKVKVPTTGPKFSFERINDIENISWDYDFTILPPKKILFPPVQTLMKYRENEYIPPQKQYPELDKNIIIFGVHSYDIVALNILDICFLAENADPYYKQKRDKTILIGIEHKPNEYNFSKDMQTHQIEKGFDLFLYKINDDYIIAVGSEKGKIILDELEVKEEASIDQVFALNDKRYADAEAIPYKMKMTNHELPNILSNSENNKMWEEINEKCFSCGSCNLVCPTCYCFDVRDNPDIDLKTGFRKRYWDGCMLREFAIVAGGENFRPNARHRLMHRFFRKGWYLKEKLGGKLACVGCGRCSQTCKAEINILDCFNKLKEEYNATCRIS
ncbi:4Fe-4S dicluster domain-containing protein [Candidatus Desantisbacteria bacterium]|nr:4Fe-4S dicluster domain-containing protein [Candidatus Desantisbacteria bacterium]